MLSDCLMNHLLMPIIAVNMSPDAHACSTSLICPYSIYCTVLGPQAHVTCECTSFVPFSMSQYGLHVNNL